jgi:tetratricopeptide (TPR) repeat protein
VVRLEPDIASGHLELGCALVHVQRYQEAVPALRTAAEKNPKSGMAHYELGLALIETGQWEAALPEMQAAVVCTPTSAQLHFYAGAVHLRLKHIPEATAEFESRAEAHAFLADAYQQLGQAENSSRERAEAAQLKSHPPE